MGDTGSARADYLWCGAAVEGDESEDVVAGKSCGEMVVVRRRSQLRTELGCARGEARPWTHPADHLRPATAGGSALGNIWFCL